MINMSKNNKRKKLAEKIEKILSSENTDTLKELISLEKQYPKDIPLKHLIGGLYQRAGDNKKARSLLESALELDTEDFATNYNLGLLNISFKKDEIAIQYLINSITYNPKFIEGYNTLGSFFYKKKKFQDAKMYLLKSVELNKTIKNMNAIIHLGLCSYQLFHYTKNLNELKNAINLYELANKLDDKNTMIADQLIRLYNRAGLKNEAIILLRKLNGVFVYNYKKNKVSISN